MNQMNQSTKFFAVYDGEYEYISSVMAEEMFWRNFGRLREYRPRYKAFESQAQAEAFAERQNAAARRQYSA